jgi:hypothetical protein
MHFKSGRSTGIGEFANKRTTLKVMVQNKVQIRCNSQSQSYLMTQSVGQSVLVQGHLGHMTSFSFTSMETIFRQLGECYYGMPCLTKGKSVIYSCCSALPAQSFLGLNPADS